MKFLNAALPITYQINLKKRTAYILHTIGNVSINLKIRPLYNIFINIIAIE